MQIAALRYYLSERGLTYADVAETTHRSESTIKKLAITYSEPRALRPRTLALFTHIAGVLDCEIRDILECVDIENRCIRARRLGDVNVIVYWMSNGGWTQTKLAEVIGVSQARVNQILNDGLPDTDASRKVCRKVAERLNHPYTTLFEINDVFKRGYKIRMLEVNA